MEDKNNNIDKQLTTQELSFFKMLNERQRRLYLGEKAISQGKSGCKIISERYGVDIKTVRQGKREFLNLEEIAPTHIRKKGGGAKKN